MRYARWPEVGMIHPSSSPICTRIATSNARSPRTLWEINNNSLDMLPPPSKFDIRDSARLYFVKPTYCTSTQSLSKQILYFANRIFVQYSEGVIAPFPIIHSALSDLIVAIVLMCPKE